jgi:opacity protein-like surface antigen
LRRSVFLGRAVVAAIVVGLVAAAPVLAQGAGRGGTTEFYISPILTQGKSFSFADGTPAKADRGYGLGVGLARNFTPNLSTGVELAWTRATYHATLQAAAGNSAGPINPTGDLDTGSVRLVGTWNLLARALTPVLTGGVGWTHVYMDIPAGYTPTRSSTTKLGWDLGAGVRWDRGSYFVRGLLLEQRIDFGGAQGASTWPQWRLDFGARIP